MSTRTRIEIVLTDGTVLPNDPDLGWNLRDVHDIKECLNETGHYRITIPGRSVVVVLANEVKEIREVEG